MSDKLPMDFGNYILQELIARGGMAEIYRAKMRTGIDGFEKPVAIKKILPNLAENDEFITMLIDEARISVTMNHANIAQVYDLGRVGESYYIAMEYIPGMDLSSMIKKLGKEGYLMPLDHAIFVTKELCAGLYYAHSKKDENGNNLGVVHRDISPHNVLVSFQGNVKVIDFGVAKASVKLGQTRMGVIKGKLLYMAPEQAMAKHLDCRADIFSAGLCLYRMLTGHLPFEADNEFQIYNNVLTAAITPPRELNPEIPEELNQVVMKSLERDVNQRYADAWLMHQDLEQVLHRVSPGYTMNRLSGFMNEYFADYRPAPMGPSRAAHASYPSAPSVNSGSYPQHSTHAPNTPSNFQPQVQQPVQVQARGPSQGGPTMPMSAAEIAAALPPSSGPSSAPPLPSPEELGFKPRNPALLEDASEFDADPTIDMQLDEEALQKMAAAARRNRPNNHATVVNPGSKPGSRPGRAAKGQEKKGGSKLPLLLALLGGGLFLLLLLGAVGFFMFSQEGGEQPAEVTPPKVVTPDKDPKPDNKPKVEAEAKPGAALRAAIPVVGDAYRQVYQEYSATVTLRLDSQPQGATVMYKRKSLGETPLVIQVDRQEDPMELVFKLSGYENTTTEVVPSTDRKATIALDERKGGSNGGGGGNGGGASASANGGSGNSAKDTKKTNNNNAGGKATGGKTGKKNGELLEPW